MDSKIVKLDKQVYLVRPPPADAIEEDEYIAGLSSIIERDFFPSLNSLRANAGIPENAIMPSTLTLDSYQQFYTSEDNASFVDIIKTQNEAKRKQYSYFYKGEQIDHVNQLEIEGLAKPVNTWEYTAKSALMYGPEEARLTIQDIPVTRAPPKALVHSATRLNDDFRLNEVKSKAEFNESSEWESTPTVRGYKMVDSTPTIEDDNNSSDLATWGKVRRTPIALEGPKFMIAEVSRREMLGKGLSEKVAKLQRQRASPRRDGGALSVIRGRIAGRSALKQSYTPVNGKRFTPLRSVHGTPL